MPIPLIAQRLRIVLNFFELFRISYGKIDRLKDDDGRII